MARQTSVLGETHRYLAFAKEWALLFLQEKGLECEESILTQMFRMKCVLVFVLFVHHYSLVTHLV